MKIDRKTVILTTLVCLLPIVAGVILYPRLPEQMATHWGFGNEPNGWSSKAFAVFGLPGLLAALNLILPFALSADPKKQNMSPALVNISLWVIPVVSVMCSAMTLCYALGYSVSVARIVPAFVGVLFIIFGNYLPKTKQSYSMGIKLPWTLNSEENWNRTHRLSGFLWVIGGAAFLMLTFFGWWNLYLLLGIILAMTLIPAVYSYLLYRKGI